jgi:FkbM family methyltransferase
MERRAALRNDALISWARRQVRRTGFDVRRLDSQASLDLFLARLCRDLRISAVIDVGANEGQFARSIRHAGYRGQIFSFEPAPEPFSILEKEAANDARWGAHQVALGRDNDLLELRTFENTVLSSFRDPNPEAVSSFDFMSDSNASMKVPVRRLDELLHEVAQPAALSRPLLKIDTQGWDTEVLLGATDIISTVQILQTELSFKALYRDQPSYRDALPLMESMGFELAALFPVVRSRNYGLIEADCVMVRLDGGS